MMNVVDFVEMQILKDPLKAIAKRFKNHEYLIERGLTSMANLKVNTTDFQENTANTFKTIQLIINGLILANFVTWIVLAGLILAFINHDHSLYGLI